MKAIKDSGGNKAAEHYRLHNERRATYSQKVLNSTSPKRLVIAGPGTGKSFLFQQIAKDLIDKGKSNILVLTFINELVKDLAVDMHGLAEVATLHSFAAKQLRNHQTIYPGLLRVVEEDFIAQKGKKANLAEVLYNLRADSDEVIDFLSNRRKYYASYDPSSIVLELINLFQNDESKIPIYDLILIDEYQDFNHLEARLIALLATKNQVLIAGDDDQSLYSFKHSKPENIRKMYKSDDFEKFELPYCSRSTRVVIEAFRDVVAKARAAGYLPDRIDKQYLYFPEEKKDKLSELYPRIEIKTQVFATKSAFVLDKSISEIFSQDPKFDVLVICSLKKQIKPLAVALRKKGYSNISGDGFSAADNQSLADGLSILVDNKDSNLGWRLSAASLMSEKPLRDAIINSMDCETPFHQCLPTEFVTMIKKLRAIAVKLGNNESLTIDEQKILFKHLDLDPGQLAEANAREKIFNTNSHSGIHCSVKIKITTILGSKGLSYDYVFLVNFDDRYLIPPKGIDDECVNKFLVALTRSRKKIFVFTSGNSEPTFVSWIDEPRKLRS